REPRLRRRPATRLLLLQSTFSARCSPERVSGGTDRLTRRAVDYFRLTQPSRVLRYRLNLALRHACCHAAHDAIRVIGARAVLEPLELRGDVFGELAGEPRILRGNPGPCGAVATTACRNAARRDAAAPDLLAERGKVLVDGARGPQLLTGVVRGEALDVVVGKVGRHRCHDRAFARGLLFGLGFEVAELLLQVLRELASDLGVGRRNAVAVGGMASRADLAGDALSSRGVLRRRRTHDNGKRAEREQAKHPRSSLVPMERRDFIRIPAS